MNIFSKDIGRQRLGNNLYTCFSALYNYFT